MKRNYLYGLCKTFGIIPSILVSLLFTAIIYISIHTGNFLGGTDSNTLSLVMAGCLYALFIGIAVIGLSGLKDKKIEFLDFLRFTGFLSSIGAVVTLSINPNPNYAAIITYAVVLDILLTQLVVRFVFARYNQEKIGMKYFVSSLCNRFNPICILVLGMVLSIVFYYLYDKMGNFMVFLDQYGNGISIGLIVVTLVLSAYRTNNHATLVDALFAVVMFTGLSSMIYCTNKFTPEQYEQILFLTMGVTLSLLIRGASYVFVEEKPSRWKLNYYYADLHSKYDISISIVVAMVLVAAVVIPAYRSEGYANLSSFFGIASLNFNDVFINVANYCVAGVLILLLILLFVVGHNRSHEIKAVDSIVNILMLTGVMAIPYFIVAFTASMEKLQNPISLLIVLIVVCVALILAIVLQVFRYIFYKKPAEEIIEEAEEPVEEAKEEEPIIIEQTQQIVESVEEPVEEPVEEQPVEEPVEEPIEEVVYVDEEGNPVDMEEEEEEPVEEEAVEEEEPEEVMVEEVPTAKEKDILVPEVSIVDENGAPKKIKRKFNTRMMFAPYETKEYYNEIKNYLQLYRAKGRYSSRCETFRYKGLVAKVALGGKSLKVCLAIDPLSLVDSKYHFKDVSQKKQYQDVPTMIKVRSPRGLKHFKELVDIMMATRGVKPKRNYEPTNYLPQLIPNGEAILATLGMSTDYLYSTMNVRSIPAEMPEDLIDFLPVIQGEDLQEEEVEATIYLDTLCNHFIDGDEITIDVLKTLHIVTKGNVLHVKARGTLDRKLIIYAEYFDSDALKMLMCTNCTAIKIVR